MPRVCNREGCGKRIVGSDGRPSYDRHFCSAGCRREDKREHMAELRRKARIGRCRFCGRKTGKDASQNTVVPRNNAPPVNFPGATGTKPRRREQEPLWGRPSLGLATSEKRATSPTQLEWHRKLP